MITDRVGAELEMGRRRERACFLGSWQTSETSVIRARCSGCQPRALLSLDVVLPAGCWCLVPAHHPGVTRLFFVPGALPTAAGLPDAGAGVRADESQAHPGAAASQKCAPRPGGRAGQGRLRAGAAPAGPSPRRGPPGPHAGCSLLVAGVFLKTDT